MNVYVVLIAHGSDFFFYVLDQKNWDKMDDRPLCEQINEVEFLAQPDDIKGLFDVIQENDWVVVESAEGEGY